MTNDREEIKEIISALDNLDCDYIEGAENMWELISLLLLDEEDGGMPYDRRIRMFGAGFKPETFLKECSARNMLKTIFQYAFFQFYPMRDYVDSFCEKRMSCEGCPLDNEKFKCGLGTTWAEAEWNEMADAGSVEDAFDLVKELENENKEVERKKKEDEIEVGDEVVDDLGKKFIVTYTFKPDGLDASRGLHGIYFDEWFPGSINSISTIYEKGTGFRKTGRHFDLSELMNFMKA